MEVTPLELEGNVHVIQGEGWFEGSNADHFLIVVEQLISKGMARLIIDCSSVNTITSNGFATLLRLSHRARRRGGDLKLAGTHGMVAEALLVTRLDTIFDLYSDVESAATAFNASQD